MSPWSEQVFLENLGAGERVRQLIDPYAQQGLELGRVCFASHEQYSLYLESGEYEATPTGLLRWDDSLPAVGDWVAARKVDRTFALIEEVLPRQTKFSRAAAGSSGREQVIATNIDVALIVSGLDHDFNLRRIERYLVLAQESGAVPLVVLNKADLCQNPGEKARSLQTDAPILILTARQSVEALKPFTRGKTVALLGSSGAGKSTIANALLGKSIQQTSAVREHDSRGRHTTTSRMLLPLPGGGALIDNPGMRELQLWASETSLDHVFDEITALAQNCHFGDCAHDQEPGCAVQEAVLSGMLTDDRWQSYRKLKAELQYQARSQDPQALSAQKKKWKVLHKALRHHPKYNR